MHRRKDIVNCRHAKEIKILSCVALYWGICKTHSVYRFFFHNSKCFLRRKDFLFFYIFSFLFLFYSILFYCVLYVCKNTH
nr:MAG TPA: hypothetical protein [Caudoviricetes sp.]